MDTQSPFFCLFLFCYNDWINNLVVDGVGAVEAAGAVVAGIGHVSTRGGGGGGADLGPLQSKEQVSYRLRSRRLFENTTDAMRP